MTPKQILARHRQIGGKIATVGKARLNSMDALRLFYTPGVATVSSYLAKHKNKTRDYTLKRNTVAVVSDGSAVLGLGNIGPEGAIPVMEGKCLIFKEFADIDAFPIVLATQDVDEIVRTVAAIAPVFGGINLEDISAPRCFEVEERLRAFLDIPVVHDDQHGTAIVVLAALINSFKVAKKDLSRVRVVVNGAGAAGSAIVNLLHKFAIGRVGDIIILDSRGIISKKRNDLDSHKRALAKITNRQNIVGGLDEAARGADVLIGVSKPGLFTAQHIKSMNKKSIIFAMANPVPEIMPADAERAGAFIIATGRSDFSNQVNNALAFPGLFRGALDHGLRRVTDEMKINAAKKLAAVVDRPTAEKIIPLVLDPRVVKAVAAAVR